MTRDRMLSIRSLVVTDVLTVKAEAKGNPLTSTFFVRIFIVKLHRLKNMEATMGNHCPAFGARYLHPS